MKSNFNAKGCRRASGHMVFAAMLLLLTAADVAAQTLSTKVWFRQSHSVIDTAYRNNGMRLDSLLDSIRRPDSLRWIRSVRVVGAASPEGSISFNRELSRKRGESILHYVAHRSGEAAVIDSSATIDFLGRDWQGLRSMVEADHEVPDRREVIEVISQAISAGGDDLRADNAALARLKAIGGGRAYRYLYSRMFPDLRYSSIYIDYGRRPAPEVILPAPELPEIPEVDTVAVEDPAPFTCICPVYAVRESDHFMDLRTNMLYDAMALPNIGVDFYLGRQWSIGANAMYGWWSNDSRHRYWRAYGGELNLRRWLGQKASERRLSGHHLGVYAGAVTYDFEFGHTGYMGGRPGGTIFDRCNYYGGVEYGYSLPVGRHINIDFTIGIGYLGGKYIKYEPCEQGGYLWQSTHRLGWFGPTKAEISLVWLIGR